jgi:hypothetical protein
LYKSARSCFAKTLSLKENYLLGHMALCMSSPLLNGKTYLGMTAGNKRQRIDLILKDQIGLAILGATLEGSLESETHIRQMVQVYDDRRKLGFITFRVSEAAMRRMLEFIGRFARSDSGRVQPSTYYGGYFWPLYEDEGAGCSAFALGVLAAADLMPPEAKAWLVDVRIPMELIGGEYNGNKRIPFSRIRRSKTWYEGNGLPNVDFVRVQTYDPSILFDWILEQRKRNDTVYVPAEEGDIPGLLLDCTNRILPTNKPYFLKRTESNLFLDHYRRKLKQDVTQPTP